MGYGYCSFSDSLVRHFSPVNEKRKKIEEIDSDLKGKLNPDYNNFSLD